MDSTRFIVRARAEGSTLDNFLAAIASDPGIEVIDTIGPEGKPHTAAIAVDEERVPSFEQAFSEHQELIIERDRPLSLLDKTMDFLHRSERKTNA